MNTGFWGSDEYDRAAQRLYEAGDYDGALAILGRGLNLFPDSVELYVSTGYAELAREQYAWARRAFEKGLALEPDHEDALVGLGEVLLKFGERTRAFRLFDRVLELGFDDDVELLVSIGRALAHEGLDGHARRFFERAVRADRGSPEPVAELAHVLHRLGDKRRARAWLERALCLDAENYEARALLANLLYERGEYARSLAEFERIPVREMWDPLAVWRTIELLRAYRRLTPEARELDPYLRRLEELSEEMGPEERLLAEIEAGPGAWGVTGDGGQTELFGDAADAEGEDTGRAPR